MRVEDGSVAAGGRREGGSRRLASLWAAFGRMGRRAKGIRVELPAAGLAMGVYG